MRNDLRARYRTLRVTLCSLACLLTACGITRTPGLEASPKTSAAGAFPRAEVEPRDVAKAVELERSLKSRYDSAAPPGTQWFDVRTDTGTVLLVAPHATSQTRADTLKAADSGSGSLALVLSGLTGSTVIHTIYRSPADPNFYDDNDFKRRLAVLVDSLRPALVLDLHASAPRRPYDVDLGTMHGKSLLGRADLLFRLSKALRDEGLYNISQDRFAASQQQTVTKWVVGMGVPAIQLEINSVWLLFECADALQEHRFAQVLQALTRFIRGVSRSAR